MKTKKLKADTSTGTGAGLSSMGAAIDAAIASPSAAPLVAVAKSELVRACGAGLVVYAPRDWSPNRKQWQPVAVRRGARGTGHGELAPVIELAAAPVVNDERRAYEATRAQIERAAIAAELDRLRVVRVAALAAGAGEVVAMAPLGAGKGSKSRALIDRGGEGAEDEARQCEVERLQRIERADNGPLLHAAGQLGERWARSWMRKETALSAKRINPETAREVVAIYRAAGVAAVMGGEVNGLLGCRKAIKAASRAAYSEVYRASGRHGKDESIDAWEDRGEFVGHGSMGSPFAPLSGAPDRSAGAGLKPSVMGELSAWGDDVRAACAAKIAAASTPAAKGNASAAAARRLELIRGLFDFANGGKGPDPDLIREYYDPGATTKKQKDAIRKRLQRLKAGIA